MIYNVGEKGTVFMNKKSPRISRMNTEKNNNKKIRENPCNPWTKNL